MGSRHHLHSPASRVRLSGGDSGCVSRKVVGWELERTLATRLPMAALENAIAERETASGFGASLRSGVQYACEDYVRILERHEMIPSMSRRANPYDNAICESFMKTLKREEIYANQYRDLDDLRANIEAFIEQYYNRSIDCIRRWATVRRSSSSGMLRFDGRSARATMSFFRHEEIFRSDERDETGSRPQPVPRAHRLDESPAGYSLASCSPAEPASASPAEAHSEGEEASLRKQNPSNGECANSKLSQQRGSPQAARPTNITRRANKRSTMVKNEETRRASPSLLFKAPRMGHRSGSRTGARGCCPGARRRTRSPSRHGPLRGFRAATVVPEHPVSPESSPHAVSRRPAPATRVRQSVDDGHRRNRSGERMIAVSGRSSHAADLLLGLRIRWLPCDSSM